jgi:hypothetical protein
MANPVSTFKRSIACAFAWALLSSLSASAAPGAAPLTIKGITSTHQVDAPVFTGLPFAPGVIRDPNLISLYIAGTKRPVQTQVISSYSDGSIRVALLGFRVTVNANQTINGEVRYGSETATPLSGLAWTRNMNVLALFSPRTYGDSTVFNLRFLPSSENTVYPAFETQLTAKYNSTSNPPSSTDPKVRSYYDHVHALIMTLLRTGGPNSLPNRLVQELNVFRESEILHTGTIEANFKGQFRGNLISGSNTWPMHINVVRRQFVTGLLEDYYYSGDQRSFDVAKELADALLYDVDRRVAANGLAFYTWTERNAAWPIKGLTAMHLATNDVRYLNGAKRVADHVLSHQRAMATQYPNQGGVAGQTGAFVQNRNGVWFDPEESSCSGCGSPFMTAILTEGLIRLYFVTADTRYRDSVVQAADWLADACYQSSSGAYLYVCRDGSSTVESLYPTFLETMGFAYHVTGNAKFRTQGEALLTRLQDEWGNHIKEFNQAMMSSGQGLYLLHRAVNTVPLTLADSGLGNNPGPGPSPSPSPSPRPSPSPSPSPSPRPSPSPSPSPRPSPAPSPSPSPRPSPSPSPSPRPSPSPSPSPRPTQTMTVNASADAHVLGSDPTTNVGTVDTLQLSSSPIKHAYVKFAVSGLSGRRVVSATLRVTVGSDGTADGPSVHTTGSSWTETGITYNNRPTTLGPVITDFGAMTARGNYTANVTAQITGDGTYSFTLQGRSADRLLLGAREGGSGPVLVIQYQ